MLKIRLQRVGRKHDASYRLVVLDSRRGPKAGNVLEVLGSYDPKKDTVSIKADRVQHWAGVGAQISDTAHNLLVSEKVIKGDKKNVLPKKAPIVTESEEEAEAPEAAEAPAETVEEAPAEEVKEEAKEAPAEEAKEEAPEAPAEEEPVKEEAPAPEAKEEPAAEEEKKD